MPDDASGPQQSGAFLLVGNGITMPADTGCDWRRLDPRFGRCVTCPLPRCRYDYTGAEQKAAAQLVERWVSQARGPQVQEDLAAVVAAWRRQEPTPAAERLPRTRPVVAEQDMVRTLLAQRALMRGRSGGAPTPASRPSRPCTATS